MGHDKMIEIIKRNFFQLGIDKYFEDFVCSCESYQRSKVWRHVRYSLRSPLELVYILWQSISIEFIVNLRKSNRYTQIWVIVDHFTMIAHLISLKDEAKRSKNTAKIFISNIWHLHRLPTDVVSDRDRRFYPFRWKYAICLTYAEEYQRPTIQRPMDRLK
jgi:hypothetical protein